MQENINKWVMKMINKTEREYIRNLAKRQLEIASLPVMAERERKWRKLNSGDPSAEPLVGVEWNGFREEIFPEFKCESDLGMNLEWQLQNNIVGYEFIGDDRVIPGFLHVPVRNGIIPFGLDIEKTIATDESGKRTFGYEIQYPVTDLERDFHLLGRSTFTVDAGLERAKREQAEYEDIVGDILPVKIQFHSFDFCLSYIMVSLMGMETMFFSMLDYPELFHRAMEMITGDYSEYMDAIEASGAILANNDVTHLNQGSWGFTDCLPSGMLGRAGREASDQPAGEIDGSMTFKDTWGFTCSQETVGLSDAMYDEFFFQYTESLSNRFGLLSYGCCEPVDGIWDRCLSRLKNLRKLSVSAWCDEEKLADSIRGKKIVYHRKPSANFIAVHDVFDEAAFAEHIAKSVTAARGCPLEITFREELTAKNQPQRIRRAVEITREQFARH